MTSRLTKSVGVVVAIGFVGAVAYALNAPKSRTDQVLAPFEFKREAAPTPEVAAQSLFLGVATASPRDFVQHLLPGVCNNEIDTLQRFAESLHATQFSHDGETFTFYNPQYHRTATSAPRLSPTRFIQMASCHSDKTLFVMRSRRT